MGTACGLWIDHTVLAATLSMAFTVLAMYSLRCLHPPGTALAVAVALGGPAFEALGFGVAWPVLMGSAVLIISALAYNRLTRGALVNAPAQPRNDSHLTDDPLPSERAGFAEADLDQALADFGEFVDITRDDLERLLRQTERVALRRGMGRVTAEHIMSRDLRTLSPTRASPTPGSCSASTASSCCRCWTPTAPWWAWSPPPTCCTTAIATHPSRCSPACARSRYACAS